MGIINIDDNEKSGEVAFEPYARLISILGDQLISDKWVGLIEIVKNSYDADAEEVKVRFQDFKVDSDPITGIIEIEDDGVGMDLDTVLNVWMKPATPNKLNKKKSQNEKVRRTEKGRMMQGDKGVGRFAVYKLGDYVEVYTKKKDEQEIKLTLDFTSYADDKFIESNHQDKFLNQILNKWERNEVPTKILNNKEQGTLIRISSPRNNWKQPDLKKLSNAFFRMMPPELPNLNISKDFDVILFWEDKKYETKLLSFDEMSEMAPFYFEGSIDDKGFIDATYTHNKKVVPIKFDLFDLENATLLKYDIKKLKLFRDIFLNEDNNSFIRKPKIGSFMFFFYGFDLRNPSESLTQVEKNFLKETSVYLYRDNIRVYPYGEIGDDWLQLSKFRSEDRAGNYFSYNDLIGFIFISQDENPILRDAADREGLMNTDGAKDEFVAILQAALKIMKDEVEEDKQKTKLKKEEAEKSAAKSYRDAFNKLKNYILKLNDKSLLDKSKTFFETTNAYVKDIKEELTITQDLAGTGMVVEKATHDTMSLLVRLKENTSDFIRRFKKNQIQSKELEEFLNNLKENIDFLYQELQVLQPLFRRARKVTKDVSFKNTAVRISKYFRKELKDKIDFKIVSGDDDLIIKTNTGLILQVILNLMDNSIYWLDQQNEDKRINIKIDSLEKTVIFADSGIGIERERKNIIFKEFYSSKADGRGLGLYIVKELLDRIDAEISLVTDNNEKILPGANFKISFKSE
ncbi:ATP-binding protein [Winogradskyella maritima]|uniref:histidine kinase n=1 Tax=Winogradskyella maritima TaxID=1517766 RepID=A0ABV8AMN5_9FLAO|nr:ATP-binding protein [Winogradskyella maritima]